VWPPPRAAIAAQVWGTPGRRVYPIWAIFQTLLAEVRSAPIGPGAKAVGSGRGAKNGSAPPPRSADPPRSGIVPEDREPIHAHFGPYPRTSGGQEKPGGPRRWVIVGRRASQSFTTRPGGAKHGRGRDPSEAAAAPACLREPRQGELPRTPFSRTGTDRVGCRKDRRAPDTVRNGARPRPFWPRRDRKPGTIASLCKVAMPKSPKARAPPV
jgi:hypothetical protein